MQNKDNVAITTNADFDSDCPKYIQDMPSRQKFRAAAMEYLFSNVNKKLVQQADEAAGEVFHYKQIPRKKLIAVHVR